MPMTQMLFRNQLPLHPRKVFVALEHLMGALGQMDKTCSALHVHARTEAERAEWGVIVKRVRTALLGALDAIDAIQYGADTYETVSDVRYVDLHRLFRLVGEIDALGRLHIRTVGTAAYTDVEERIADVHQRVVRLGETHVENDPALRPPASARKGVIRAA